MGRLGGMTSHQTLTRNAIEAEALSLRGRLREIEADTTHLNDLQNLMEAAAINGRLAELWPLWQNAGWA